MPDETVCWQSVEYSVEYEGFEIHITARPKEPPAPDRPHVAARYTYIGYVCQPGANPAVPGHTVPFHADGEDTFTNAEEAHDEAVQVGRSIVDGTHPDLTVLPLVTGGL
ncbi:MAG TPA: hypothetical protein VGL08_06255 [Paraburkholderia sp.]|jgi:hypothetical protein